MKQTCQECKSIIEIDEKKYTPGENVLINCPLCGTAVIFTIPELEIPKPEIVEKIVVKEVENLEHLRRINELEQEIRGIKERQKQNSADEAYSSSTKQDSVVTNSQQVGLERGGRIRFIFSFKGRINRREYVLSLIIYYSLYAFCVKSEVPWIILPFAFWLLVAQGAKRCHDLNHSGWYQLIPFYFLWMMFAEGDGCYCNDYGCKNDL